MMQRSRSWSWCLLLGGWLAAISEPAIAADDGLTVHLRRRQEVAEGTQRWHSLVEEQRWDPKKTAIVVCDMWDKHWCPNATKRVAEMAPRMNEVLLAARKRGVTIIHCPSDTLDFYKDHPGRKLAQAAPIVPVKRPLERWCRLDAQQEAPLPIDDSDGGCDCEEPAPNYRAWSRQIATLEIQPGDAITDSAEAYYVMRQRGIENVIVMGVHTNMCVLGRPFSIRQLVYQGLKVALMRDMTDTMYNPARAPYVSHFTGNDLVAEHIEQYWCPSLTSVDFLGGTPFRFSDDRRPHLAIVCAEDEYKTELALPSFGREQLGRDYRVSYVFETPSKKYDLPGLSILSEADAALISVRRRPLPADQLEVVRKFVASGKPMLGIRTASHAFALREQLPAGLAAWPEFDAEVWGGNYQLHYANDATTWIKQTGPVDHPILKGIGAAEFLAGSSLYRNAPLPAGPQVLLTGRMEGTDIVEPVAWTFKRADGGKSFYTSLGHYADFEQPAFVQLLRNAIAWAVPSPMTPTAGSNGWERTKVPGLWQASRPDLERYAGYAWYRSGVQIPQAWKGRQLLLSIEKITSASECYVNGVKVGVSGAFPPKYATGAENQHRYVVPESAIKWGAVNTICIRVFHSDGKGGFAGSAPRLDGNNETIVLDGEWEYRLGDDPGWALTTAHGQKFEAITATPAVSPFATIIRRMPQTAALPTDQSLALAKVPADLQLELALAEPHAQQPVFFNFDTRGRLWVMEYLQYPEPAGLKLLSKDAHWRAVYDKVPEPPPHGDKGDDRITIHEDTDGDGLFDKHSVFLDGLNIATAFVQGRGGLWVLNPPYLLFYPDRDHDDRPDGDPEVHLAGFGLEDTHSVVNSLRWGPDGWLYAAQGSTVSANVKRPGIDLDKEGVRSQGQHIWRYHPETRRFEIYSEGGGNAFGVEIDAQGRVFSGTNGGNSRGFHYQQGAYLQKGFNKHGPLSNPYSFGYFPAMEHDQTPRFTHTFLIYQGLALPEFYRGKVFGVNPMMNQVTLSELIPIGTTFKTHDVTPAIDSADNWFRPVDIKEGPDGAVYVADWCDGQLAHTANYQGGIDKTHGRIWRLKAKQPAPRSAGPARLGQPGSKLPAAWSDEQLIALLDDGDRWQRQAALEVLAERRSASAVRLLRERLLGPPAATALNQLWGLYASGGADALVANQLAQRLFQHADPQVRLWTVRLLADDRRLPSDLVQPVIELSRREPHAEVRSQLAASAKRLPTEQALPILVALMRHGEDVDDPRLPLQLWWGLEAHLTVPSALATAAPGPGAGTGPAQTAAVGDPRAVLNLFLGADKSLWSEPLVTKEILPRLMRRYAVTNARTDLQVCSELLRNAPNPPATAALMRGFEEAYQGRSLQSVPAELVTALAAAGGGSLSLKVRQGDSTGIGEALKLIADEKASAGKRIELIRLFSEVTSADCVPVLLEVLQKTADDGLKGEILSTLAAYADPRILSTVLASFRQQQEDVRLAMVALAASRQDWAVTFLEAIDRGDIPLQQVPREASQRFSAHRLPRIQQLQEKLWGKSPEVSPAAIAERVEHFEKLLAGGGGNPYPGKKLYLQTCGKCHLLHGTGGQIGPDLTPFRRQDTRQMLLNIVHPSLEIREGYEAWTALTTSGRVVTGFIADRDPQTLVLRTPDGQTVSLPRDSIEELTPQKKSIMPEGQLEPLTPEQIRDLFSYLRMTQPLPD